MEGREIIRRRGVRPAHFAHLVVLVVAIACSPAASSRPPDPRPTLGSVAEPVLREEPSVSERPTASSTTPDDAASGNAVRSNAVSEEMRGHELVATVLRTGSATLVGAHEARGGVRVVANAGSVRFDAVVRSAREVPRLWAHARASASLPSSVRELRAYGAFVLVTDGPTRALCPVAEGPCREVPRDGAVRSLFAFDDVASLSIVEGDLSNAWNVTWSTGRALQTERWRESSRFDVGPPTRRVRASRTQLALPHVPRPDWLTAQHRMDECLLQVTSLREGSMEVVYTRCASDPGESTPSSVRILSGSSVVAFPAEVVELDETPMSVIDAREGFVAWRSRHDDGGSPSGVMYERLHVADVASGSGLVSFDVGKIAIDGLGAGPEGYVVSVAKRRLRVGLSVPSGATFPDALRVEGCEGWVGEHHRRSDRWSGRACTQTLDVTLPVSPERGVVVNDDVRAVLDACCPLPR